MEAQKANLQRRVRDLNMSIVVFYVLAAICLGGGLGAVVSRNVVYAAFSLLLSLMGIAGIFLLLLAEFLALVQILIYGGAITIVILFVIMLTRSQEVRTATDNPHRPLAIIAGLVVFAIMTTAMVNGISDSKTTKPVEFTDLGNSLFTQWAIPFEVASLVLLVALIGAIVIARQGNQE